jgi:hypothetical protein
LLQLEVAKESRILNVLETWLLGRLKKCSLALASLIRSVARTRSRIAWLKDGDANTKLFHSWSRHRKRKNFIAKIQDGEQLVTSHSDKAEVLRSFYSDLIGTGQQRSRIVNLDTLGLQHIDLQGLEQPTSEAEVWNTIKQLPPDKVPGPDGFTGRFYKACWSIIKKDIMAAILAVWNKDFRNFRYLNTAFITLLPKKEDAILAKDFLPISLIHRFAKLITKIMANRLSGYMDKLISKNQSAFIKGRFIQDNFMLVQQTARLLHAQKQPRILLKLDISKAFDSVSWSFLLEVLEKVGFGHRWRDVISGLLMTSSTQIMLNGVPGEYIQHKRGLRQGDSLSPLLFIIVMNVLNGLIVKAADEGLLQPLSTRSIQHRISLYADDVVIFLRPAASDLHLVTRILELFGGAKNQRTEKQCGSHSLLSGGHGNGNLDFSLQS